LIAAGIGGFAFHVARKSVERRKTAVPFLRSAANGLRRLAATVPEIREQLPRIAQQLDAEADDLAAKPSRLTNYPRPQSRVLGYAASATGTGASSFSVRR